MKLRNAQEMSFDHLVQPTSQRVCPNQPLPTPKNQYPQIPLIAFVRQKRRKYLQLNALPLALNYLDCFIWEETRKLYFQLESNL